MRNSPTHVDTQGPVAEVLAVLVFHTLVSSRQSHSLTSRALFGFDTQTHPRLPLPASRLAVFSKLPQPTLDFWNDLYTLMTRNLSNNTFQVQDMADHFHLSVRQFSRVCKKHLKHTPIEVLREVKLQEAHRLLIQEEVQSIKALCHALGISSGGHFSKLFQNRFGYYPSDLLKHRYYKMG
ncbi:MAG: helix-turn-helix domain-containing protein [Bacteroidota bacterium]